LEYGIGLSQSEFTEKVDSFVSIFVRAAVMDDLETLIAAAEKIVEMKRQKYAFPYAIFAANAVPEIICSLISRDLETSIVSAALELSVVLTSGPLVSRFCNGKFIAQMLVIIHSTVSDATPCAFRALFCLQNISKSGKEGCRALIESHVVESFGHVIQASPNDQIIQEFLWIFSNMVKSKDSFFERVATLEIILEYFLWAISTDLENRQAPALWGLSSICENWVEAQRTFITRELISKIVLFSSSSDHFLAVPAIRVLIALLKHDFPDKIASLLARGWILERWTNGNDNVRLELCHLMLHIPGEINKGLIEVMLDDLDGCNFELKVAIVEYLGSILAIDTYGDLIKIVAKRLLFSVLEELLQTSEERVLVPVLGLLSLILEFQVRTGSLDLCSVDFELLNVQLNALENFSALSVQLRVLDDLVSKSFAS
jgi:hypothetical protein